MASYPRKVGRITTVATYPAVNRTTDQYGYQPQMRPWPRIVERPAANDVSGDGRPSDSCIAKKPALPAVRHGYDEDGYAIQEPRERRHYGSFED